MIRRLFFLLLAVLFPALSVQQAFAISATDQQSIYGDSEYYDPDSGSCGSSGDTTVLTGSDNEQEIWNFFKGKGLSDGQVAGIVGNLQDESGFDPERSQDGGNTQVPSTGLNVGWGLAQWTRTVYTTGPDNPVIGDAKTYDITTPIYELATQLNLIWAEMGGSSPTGAQDMLKGLQQINDPTASATAKDAAEYFEAYFEEGVAATDAGAGNLAGRQQFAQKALTTYGGTSDGSGGTTTGGDGSGDTSDCAGATVDCSSSATAATSGLSQTRQSVVCLAEQELALWKSQPGYSQAPNFPYAETGYLKYVESGTPEEWCADFVSWVYNQAGDPVQAGSNWDIANVGDMEEVGTPGSTLYNSNFTWHAEGSGYTPQPGDIAIHLNGVSHTNIFISSSGGTSTYIGGDQGPPPYPGGSIVSIETGSGYYDNGITGYVSPNN